MLKLVELTVTPEGCEGSLAESRSLMGALALSVVLLLAFVVAQLLWDSGELWLFWLGILGNLLVLFGVRRLPSLQGAFKTRPGEVVITRDGKERPLAFAGLMVRRTANVVRLVPATGEAVTITVDAANQPMLEDFADVLQQLAQRFEGGLEDVPPQLRELERARPE